MTSIIIEKEYWNTVDGRCKVVIEALGHIIRPIKANIRLDKDARKKRPRTRQPARWMQEERIDFLR